MITRAALLKRCSCGLTQSVNRVLSLIVYCLLLFIVYFVCVSYIGYVTVLRWDCCYNHLLNQVRWDCGWRKVRYYDNNTCKQGEMTYHSIFI